MKKIIEKLGANKRYSTIALWIFFTLFSLIIFFLHYNFATAFSFVDEYTHYVAADYLAKGKFLYQDVFFQHQPLPVYLSFVIQQVLQPDTLYKLVIEHRLFIFAFSLIVDILLVLRFRFVGLGFVVVYELTKYYMFGNLFLGETFVSPILVYLLGLLWEKLQKRKLLFIDFIVVGIFTWFVIFMREPYTPAALLLFIFIMFGKGEYKPKFFSTILLIILSLLTLLTLSINSYITDLITVNFSGYAQHEIATSSLSYLGIFKILFYPFVIPFTGQWNEFRIILIFLDILFFVFVSIYLFGEKQKAKDRKFRIGNILLICLVLSFCAIRISDPGNLFYSSFHMLPWYAAFIMSIFLLANEIVFKKYLYTYKSLITIFIITTVSGIILFYPNSYMTRKFDREVLFTTNYARFYTIGNVMKILGDKDSTIFVDQWDSLIYWQAGLPSGYHYVFSYPVMGHFYKFNQARVDMFGRGEPDFYYTDCGKDVYSISFAPQEVMDTYAQLRLNGKPVCLYVKKALVPTISDKQWEEVATLGISR